MRFETVYTDHGVPLHVYSMPHAHSVAVAVVNGVGTRDEKWPKQAGIAHADEHMKFKGNKRLGDSYAISAEIEDLGGMMNASTGKEYTVHHRLVPAHAFDVAVQSLASHLTTPLFRPADIEIEMDNIVQELYKYRDMPDAFCAMIHDELLYGDHPLNREVLGTEEAILAFTQEDFREFHSDFYHTGNYTFIAVGNVTAAEALRTFNDADFGRGNLPNRRMFFRAPLATEKTRVVERGGIDQAQVKLGTLVGPSHAPHTKALAFFSAMIDGGQSFPLFIEVRDKRGLCYDVSAGLSPATDYGSFDASIGTDPEQVEASVDCIHEVIEKSHTDAALFARAKTCLLGQNALRFETPQAILDQAIHDVTYGLLKLPRSPEEILNGIQAQTHTNVIEAVSKYLLDRSTYAYAYVVPKGTKV